MRKNENRVKRILVIGMNRSGTKGLSNELGYHKDIAIIGDDSHYGILITPVYEVMDSKFNLNQTEEYIAAVSMLCETDFFRISGIEKAFFFELKPRPKNFPDLFKAVMDEYANRSVKKAWLQKTSPRGFWRNREVLNDYEIVIIKRGMKENIRSRLGSAIRLGKKTGKTKRLLRSIFLYVMEEKLIKKIAKSRQHIYVDFKDFKSDSKKVCEHIFHELNLDPLQYDDSRRFPRNTSFDGSVSKGDVLSKTDLSIIAIVSCSFQICPLWLLYSLRERSIEAPTPIGPGAFNHIHREFRI